MRNNQDSRILIFSMTYLPYVGGAELAIKEITDRIDNIEFDLITARLDKKNKSIERIGSCNIYRVGQGWFLDKYLYPFLAYYQAQKLHQKRNYQIVQAVMAFYAGFAALLFKKKYPKVKYLLTMQSGDSSFFIWIRTWWWYFWYRQIYSKADYIQVISSYLKKRARFYGYQGSIEIIPNGVDLNIFKKISWPVSLAQKIGLSEEDQIVIISSRLAKKNGLNDLIKAIKKIPVKLLLLGSGPEKNRLKQLVKNLNLTDKVVFIGQIPHQDLPYYLALADVFVRPSLSEGLGSAFLEAMACQLPVVATPVGGIVDFLEDGRTGLYCQPKNPRDIAEKIKILIDNKELREKIIENSLVMVRQEYNWDQISQKIESIYHKLIYDK